MAAAPQRLFVALPLPANIKESLVAWRRRLEADLPASGLKWVPPHQYHLTLKFLGDVDPATIPALVQALNQACAGRPPLHLATAALGAFPHSRRPAVLWVGVRGDLEPLLDLQRAIEHGVGPASPSEPENRFHPHFTLARIKSPHRSLAQRLSRLCEDDTINPSVAWDARQVELWRSELQPGGAHYTTLAKAALDG